MAGSRLSGAARLEPPAPAPYRGSLRIGERVVEKIAARAAKEATGAAAPDTKLREPKAGVKVRNDHATVKLDLDVPYPGRITDIAGTVRHRVRDDVERLTGMPVIRIDVVVGRMTRIGKGRRRVQ
ncbi:Asp23/Gls24 family envelope stress response protein [Yinghuangia seranimata]|uniref:Asp23/Gls24 family envelope stress response protein n=1 Tax=Yinghuangia seranimata TaxID=408067 RepID=UPI00248BD263|nr:Asp23/Gls24 family envelope stress response protein [Yinghuangia seranimata]MDI2126340.1 Asp23/Gls24 family envelope stress response protein [Yinghuangia seranimata]